MVPPALTVVWLSVLVTAISACGLTVSVSVPVLLPGVGSVTPAGGLMLALLVTEPLVAVTFALTVKTRLPPAGKVGITMPVLCNRAVVVLAALGQTAEPVGVPQVTPVTFRPATAGSVTTALSAALGPLLVTVRVYTVVPPAVRLEPPLVLTSCRSARGLTVSVSVPVLLPGVGSVTPVGGATVAAFVTLPEVAVTLALTVKTRLPPAGRVGITMPAPSSSATVLKAGQTAPASSVPHVTLVLARPATAASVTTALFAALRPLLVMVKV